ncbi:hypothetical protein [Arcicella rigui]|uniref:Uncharacterized protein n=1 Tax=Arcicella rigui TaxID=797020 RepID=A0ABU5Q8C2_9BACT|nr:hypothetical protein [Arcicella rigui]MEA5139095.1 hypothetical protein [Arcicella rigui]
MENNKFDIEKISRENIFKVPENYFENLPMQIQAKTSGRAKVIPLVSWSMKRTWASLAACSIIVILAYFTWMPKQDALSNEALSEVQNKEIVNYLIQEDVSQSDIAEHFEEEDVKVSNDSELLDYLKLNDKDIIQSIDLENLEEDI